MLPSLSKNYRRNHRLSGSNFVGNRLLCHSTFSHSAYLKYFAGCKSRVPNSLALCLPSFVVPILVVIGRCAQKQMRWVAATWPVARVANAKTFSNWANMHQIGKSVRFLERLRFWVECSVPVLVKVSSPKPAPSIFWRLRNFAQKSILYRHEFFCHASSVHQKPFAMRGLV